MTKSKGNYSRVPNKRTSSYFFFQKFSNSPALISFYFIKISNPSCLFRPPSPRLFDFTWWSNPPRLLRPPIYLAPKRTDIIKFTEEILNGKFVFCAVSALPNVFLTPSFIYQGQSSEIFLIKYALNNLVK